MWTEIIWRHVVFLWSFSYATHSVGSSIVWCLMEGWIDRKSGVELRAWFALIIVLIVRDYASRWLTPGHWREHGILATMESEAETCIAVSRLPGHTSTMMVSTINNVRERSSNNTFHFIHYLADSCQSQFNQWEKEKQFSRISVSSNTFEQTFSSKYVSTTTYR